ncbi:MAG: ribonuclease P protein component [Tissierellia bacterium]|nr:ribonuclease P protein component [Tissierellia bacterium]
MNPGYKSIKKNEDYRAVYKSGIIKNSPYFTLTYLDNNKDETRIGIAVSKKTGNSVKRNRIKRRMREIIRKNYSKIKKGFDLVIVMRDKSESLSFSELEGIFIDIIKDIGLWQE